MLKSPVISRMSSFTARARIIGISLNLLKLILKSDVFELFRFRIVINSCLFISIFDSYAFECQVSNNKSRRS